MNELFIIGSTGFRSNSMYALRALHQDCSSVISYRICISMASTGNQSKGKSVGPVTREKERPVELGFVEPDTETWRLSSAYFASKFGGKPSWLDLKNIPTFENLQCSQCSAPTKFLLQVYSPLNSEESFHRTIYLFVCVNKQCCVEKNSNKNFVVLRCVLKQENDFYSSEPPDYEDKKLADINPEKFGHNLCHVCGIKASKFCSKCKKIWYCSKQHQEFHWKRDGHKKSCKEPETGSGSEEATGSTDTGSVGSNSWILTEQEIVIDTEVIPKVTKEKSDKTKLEEFEKLVESGKTGTMEGIASTKDLLEAASYKSDKDFNKFKKRVAYEPDQILRYDRTSGSPLWVSSKDVPKTIPPCPYCHGPRIFEFQVMPQLLNHVGYDATEGDLDWGTVAVYTCKNDCNEGPAYKKEFCWRQDFSHGPNE